MSNDWKLETLAVQAGYTPENGGAHTVPITQSTTYNYDDAQSVADQLIAGGIKAIWNFAPVHLEVPSNILVQYENMATSLAVLSVHLQAQIKEEKG